MQSMVSKQTVCLRQLAGSRAREVQYGRWLANDKVTPAQLIDSACKRTGAIAAGRRHVLAIQDTTELNHQAHAGRVSGLGTVGNGSDVGMFLHPLLAVDACDGACLGLAHIHHWIRTGKASTDYRKLPIEDRESCRWLDVAEAGKKCLSEAAMVTLIADREAISMKNGRGCLTSARICSRVLAVTAPWPLAINCMRGSMRNPHKAPTALTCRPARASAAPTEPRWKYALGVSRFGVPPPARTKAHRRRLN